MDRSCFFTGVDISAGHHGWSIRTLKGVVAEAGAHLEKLEAEITETGRCYSVKMSCVAVPFMSSYVSFECK